jgi:hypothetical protein
MPASSAFLDVHPRFRNEMIRPVTPEPARHHLPRVRCVFAVAAVRARRQVIGARR